MSIAPLSLTQRVGVVLCADTFVLLGQLCASTGLEGSCSFEGLWAATLGPSSACLVSASIGTLTFFICSVYLICLGELLPPLLDSIGVPTRLRSRRAAILLAAGLVLPSCFARSLAGLAAISLLGVGALAYTALFSMWRYLDGSYASGGRFHAAMPVKLRASFGTQTRAWRVSRNTAVLVANLGVALCAHFNAPSFYRSLKDSSPARFGLMAYISFGAVFVLTLLIALPGYFTFGGACQPLVLTNYHPTADRAASAARVATAASLCCSFPLVFAALREAVLTVATSRGGAAAAGVAGGRAWWLATVLLPALAVMLALLVADLGLVVGLLGSLLGGGIMYVAPAAMHAAALLARTGGAAAAPLALLADVALIVYGVVGQMVVGTTVTWRNSQGNSE